MKRNKNSLPTLLLLALLIWSIQINCSMAQSASFGNTFISAGNEMVVHRSNHSFLNGGSGTLPGIIATARNATPGLGYFSFVGSGAAHSGAADNAHVDGYVRTYLTSAFTFPIGNNGKYRPAAVSAASVASPADAAYFASNPTTNGFSTTSMGAGLTGVSNVEYWDINGATSARITLTWNAASNIGSLTSMDLNTLSIVGWNGTQWVRIASAADNSALLTGTPSTLIAGSITTTNAFAPGTYQVYALGTSQGVDTDGDGVVDADDPAPNDPCSPNAGSPACTTTASLSAKVLLQGALLGSTTPGIMRDNLRTGNYIPITDPYSGSGNTRFTHYGDGATATTTASVLNANAGSNNAIVDWVFVELRSSTTAIVETRAALVQRDGDVVSPVDGTSPLLFPGRTGQAVYVAIKHRNHLGAMTANPITLTASATSVDFTTMSNADLFNNTAAYDGSETASVGGVKALWASNVNGDIRVQYQGIASDLPGGLNQVINYGSNTSKLYNFNGAFGYWTGDVNMDGNVKYQGSNNDVLPILNNILSYDLNSNRLYNYAGFVEQIPQ